MTRLAWDCWYSLARPRLLAAGLCAAGLVLAGPGCAQLNTPGHSVQATVQQQPLADSRHPGRAGLGFSADDSEPAATAPAAPIRLASATSVDRLPASLPPSAPGTPMHRPGTAVAVQPSGEAPALLHPPTPLPSGGQPAAALPIGLDTVFRLAEEQNPQIALARERVNEAYAEQDIAQAKWLPDVYLGTAYYRHEGGISNEDGTITHSSFGAMFAGSELSSRLDLRDIAYQQVNARRQVWQQKGELSRVTSQTLLDAANTYIDWLTARHGEAIARDMVVDLTDLIGYARGRVKGEPGAEVEVSRIEAELDAQQQNVLKLRQEASAAAAKLLYVLGLDPATPLLPLDSRLLPFDLIDATPPTESLVAQALTTGPGVQEMEGLLALIQQSIERSEGPGKYLPVFQVCMAEGGFGTGPGDTMSWDNRWDLGVQARWNLTQLASAGDRRRVAQSKMHQAHLAYQDLRGKLTAGVQEARDAVLSGRAQFRHTQEQIRNARAAFGLSNQRLRQRIPGSSASETLLALGAVGRARANYLAVTSAYDKAQLRLLVLLGPTATIPCHAAPTGH